MTTQWCVFVLQFEAEETKLRDIHDLSRGDTARKWPSEIQYCFYLTSKSILFLATSCYHPNLFNSIPKIFIRSYSYSHRI